GVYSLTRRGKLSVGITKPPIADENLVFLTEDNILDPQNIRPSRSTSSRHFYNEVQFYFDMDDEGEFRAVRKVEDEDSKEVTGLTSVLKIESQGSKSELNSDEVLNRIATFLLARYKRGAISFSVPI